MFKEIWTFRSSAARWTEVYYSIDDTLEEAANFTNELVNKRLALLNDSNVLQKIRCSNMDGSRSSVVVQQNKHGTGTASFAKNPANTVEAAVVSLVSTVAGSSRRLWLRGMPEDAVYRSDDGNYDIIAPAFNTALRTWIRALQNNNYIVLTRTKVTVPGFQWRRILGVNGEARNGTSILTLAGNAGINDGDTITITQASNKDLPGLNGLWKVVSSTGTTLTINYNTPRGDNYQISKGRVRKIVYRTDARINANVSAFAFLGGRKTKNDATGSRGARSAQRIRSQF